jgi:hypothetical protein
LDVHVSARPLSAPPPLSAAQEASLKALDADKTDLEQRVHTLQARLDRDSEKETLKKKLAGPCSFLCVNVFVCWRGSAALPFLHGRLLCCTGMASLRCLVHFWEVSLVCEMPLLLLQCWRRV